MQYYRVKDQPDVVGQIDVSKRTIRGGKVREYLRTAPNKGGYYFIDALEPYTPDTTDAFELLNDGKFGRLENLRWRLLSARLNGNLSNHIYSMEITKTDFYAYQFKPVLRLLESPSKSILIADEVGLGKTIEAGLIWTELRARYAHSRLVVLCPSFLTDKWKGELSDRFGVECDVVKGYELMEKLSSFHTSSTKRSFALIASFEGSRRNEELIEFLEQESVKSPLIDFLVVDEAHAARNPNSLTNRVTQSLRDVADFVAFLSATPIMLKSRDMFQMLNILDSFTYRHEEVFEYIVKANQPLIRLRSQVLEHKPPRANEVISTLTDLQPGSGLQPALFQRESSAELVQFVSDNAEDQDAPLSDSMRADICERLDYSNMNSLIVNRTRRREAMLNQSERVPTDLMFEMSERESELYHTVSHIVRE
ncbi:MAG: SNF2-related protein, partial [Candidatus Kapaibacterium sp.]